MAKKTKAEHKAHKESLKELVKKLSPGAVIKDMKGKLGGGVLIHAANKVNPAFITLRGGVLGLIDLNLVGIASAYKLVEQAKNPKHWNDMLNFWWEMGGEKDKYLDAVNKGASKKHLLEKEFDAFHGKKKVAKKNLENIDTTTPPPNAGSQIAKAGAAIMGVSPVATAIDPEGGEAVTGYIAAAGAVLTGLGASAKKSAQEQGATPQQLAGVPVTPLDVNGNPTSGVAPSSTLPASPDQLAQLNKEIDNTNDDDAEASDRAVLREGKIETGTYTQADAAADLAADETDRQNLRSVTKKTDKAKTPAHITWWQKLFHIHTS